MSNAVVPHRPALPAVSFGEMQDLAAAIAKSRLFSIQTADQALVLMAISQAEGRHPALAARDYDIIQGRPAKKSEAMMRDFIDSSGRVEWHVLADTEAEATFSHPSGGTVRIRWDTARVQQAGLAGKDMHRKYPRQMLRARVVSEGVRTVCPMATSGMYVPEEVSDFEARPMRDATPPASPVPVAAPVPAAAPFQPPHDPETGEVGPHKIAVPTRNGTGLADWTAFGGVMVSAFRSAESLADLAEWQRLNAAAITDMSGAWPKGHAILVQRIDECIEKLTVEPEPDLPPSPPLDAEPEMLTAEETEGVLG